MRNIINITKALSDENRVRALMMLCEGELCVCQLIQMLGLAPSTVSKHMSILYQAGLVDARKEGRWNYYRPADEDAPEFVLEAIRWVRNSLTGDKRIDSDAERLSAIRKKSMEELCKCYRSARSRNSKLANRKADKLDVQKAK